MSQRVMFYSEKGYTPCIQKKRTSEQSHWKVILKGHINDSLKK